MTTDEVWNGTYELLANGGNDDEVSALLNKLAECSGTNMEISMLRAYIAYHFPGTATRSINIRAELESVLEAEPTNTTASLFLSHFHYDSGNFSEALSYLQTIDVGRYISAGQVWRVLKIEEMKLAAKTYLSADSVDPNNVIEFADKLISSGVEDTAVPTELIKALLANKSVIARTWTTPVLRNVVSHLRCAIDQIAGTCVLKKETDMIAT